MFEKNLFLADADYKAQAEIYASIDVRRRLVVEYRYENDRNPCWDFTRRATVDSDDTARMAAYYKVAVEQLPQLIFEKCGIAYAAAPSEADGVFKQALNMILDARVRYKMSEF